MPLRWYQQEASDAVIDWIRQSIEPCLVDAATGAGKSHVIADIARRVHDISKGKKVLCLAPSAELVEQNVDKYRATGNPASMFSASAGETCLRHSVVFGTPLTVKNKIRRFGKEFAAVIIDEAHGLTPSIKYIVDQLRELNPKLRVIGLTATPYRLGDGYIYKLDENGKPVPDRGVTDDAYFTKCVYKVAAHTLIKEGYLTPPTIGSPQAGQYDTSGLVLNSQNKFNADDVDRAFHGHGRLTSQIVADIIAQSRGRKAVMIFAATLQHAAEVMASLPPSLSALIDGGTKKADRRRIIKAFKLGKIRYLVNVQVLTTGFDASIVDVIAIMRFTESAGLLQQIVGRGLRLHEGKYDCLILDYAGNLEKHCPDGDLFSPEIKAHKKEGSESGLINACCPDCSTDNTFSARKNTEGFEVDAQGYFIDLDGNRVMANEGPIPAHYGRRCMGLYPVSGGTYAQCNYRWTSKRCPACMEHNDIAARYCTDCRAELIDPNEKLKLDFTRFKKDPTQIQCDRVVSWQQRKTMSRAGNECIRVDYVTEYRQFSIWYMPEAKRGKPLADWRQFSDATAGGENMPETITYKKDTETKMYRVFGYNQKEDSPDEV